MTIGTILRGHAGGFLVYQKELDTTLKCQVRGRLKKERISVITGDRVKIEQLELEKNTAVISARLPRQNSLSRPQLANVDQVLIVQAIHQPEWNPTLCDRYIVHFQLELAPSRPILCFNKCDLASSKEIEALRRIYEKLGYFVMILSAKTGEGMQDLDKTLQQKTSVIAGPSGVGKSSLLNYLEPTLNIKVGLMENTFGVGRHTTTSSELHCIGISQSKSPGTINWVADTPGFNLTELKYPSPLDVYKQFFEIKELASKCQFSDCLHIVEEGCNVIANIDKIPPSRYESYCTLVEKAQIEYKLKQDSSQKTEATTKMVGGSKGKAKHIPKLQGKYRAASRRTERQKLLHNTDFNEKNVD